jgi:hypothetical protein
MVACSLLILGLSCRQPNDPLSRTKELLLHEPQKAAIFLQNHTAEEQVYIVTQLSEEIPQRIMPLCELLEGGAKKRCVRIAHRPHLWEHVQTGAKKDIAITKDCAHPHLCTEEKAIAAVRSRKVEEARDLCISIEEEVWKQECLFHISERLLIDNPTQYATTLSLCEQAILFRDNCIQHGVFKLASAFLLEKYTPEEVEKEIQKIKKIWTKHNPEEASVRISQLRAQWFHRYFETEQLDRDSLSPEWIHHYHSTLAFWGLQYARDLDEDLIVHIQKLDDETISIREKPRGIEPALLLWDLPLEQGEVYLGFSMRLVDTDPQIDLLIATLEAIARLRPPKMDLLLPFRSHPNTKVQNTAKRLLSFDVYHPKPLLKPLSMSNKSIELEHKNKQLK